MFAARGGFTYQVGNNGYITIITSGSSEKFIAASGGSVGYVTGVAATGNISLMKLNNVGTIQWQKTITGSGSTDIANDMVIDSSENMYISCESQAGGIGGYDMLLMKFDNTGNITWQKSLGTSSNDYGYSIAIDSTGGNIFVGGRSNVESLLTKYNSSGTLQWQYTLGGELGVSSLALDSSNNLIILSYDTSDASDNGMQIRKWNSSDVSQWTRNISLSGADINSSESICTVDGSGNIYAGIHRNSNDNQWIVKYNSSGTLQWQKLLSQNMNGIRGMCVDSSNNLYVSAYSTDSTKPIWIAKFDSSGDITWQRYFTATGNPASQAHKLTWNNGFIYVTGFTDYPGSSQALILKLPDDGTGTGTYGPYTYGTTSYTVSAGSLSSSSTTDSSSVLGLTGATPSLTSANSSFTQTTYNI